MSRKVLVETSFLGDKNSVFIPRCVKMPLGQNNVIRGRRWLNLESVQLT